MVAVVGLAAPSGRAADAVAPSRWLSLDLKQPITVATEEYLSAAFARARAEGLDGIVLSLDTPGGSLEATRKIVESFLASELPIIVYVSPAGARAGSAGVFLTLAANVAAMQPASNIGAAHPVTSSGKDVEAEEGKEMARKVENDTAAFAKSIAKARGRNEVWAEQAVRESVSVTAAEALKLHVVDLLAVDLTELLARTDGRTVVTRGGPRVLHTKNASLEPMGMSVRQRLLGLLADPNLAALLMLLGMAGVGFELYHPGSFVPGVVGGLALVLGLLATQVIPVNAGAVLLLLAGAALLVTEAYVPTHGAAGGAGALALALGTLLFIDKSSPDYRFDPSGLSLSPLVVWPIPIALGLVMAFVATRVAASRRGPLLAGAAGLVGERGEALSEVTPAGGQIFVHGEYWKACSAEAVPQGARVRVVAVEGLVARVVVESTPAPR
jgi:membrane-bound serine protease (ClpP class)